MRETVVYDSCTVQPGGPQARENPNSPISLGIAAATAEDRILEDHDDGARGTDPRARARRNTCLPRKRLSQVCSLNHTVAEANKRLNIAPKKSRKSREPAFTKTMLAYWPRYFRQKITGLIETASTKYCSSVREKAEIG